MDQKFSPRVREIMFHSQEEAVKMGSPHIGLEHIFLGITDDNGSNAVRILGDLGVDIEAFRLKLEASIKSNTANNGRKAAELPLTKQAERAIKFTYIVAKDFNSEQVSSEHLMLAILHDDNNIISQRLEYEGVTFEKYKKEVENMTFNHPKTSVEKESTDVPMGLFQDDDDDDISYSAETTQRKESSKSQTPVLDSFGRDLTRAAEENRLDPIVGRERELERICQILSRRKKNNPILIGEPGVGKSAIAEGLASRIVVFKMGNIFSFYNASSPPVSWSTRCRAHCSTRRFIC